MLNARCFFIFIFLCGLLFLATGVHAQSSYLQTKDGACRFYYFTPKNTQGWYIEITEDLCEDGLVSGQGEVTVYNAFLKPVEQIYGFFNEGYWTGNMSISVPVIYNTVEFDGTQKVFFGVPNETYYNFQLIGQMTSQKQKDGTYSPFVFCKPFRVLMQTEEPEVFQDNKKVIEIIDAIAKQARNYCPAEEAIQLYAARVERPSHEDVFFFAEVDLRAARIVVKRNVPVLNTTPTAGMPSPSVGTFLENAYAPDRQVDTAAKRVYAQNTLPVIQEDFEQNKSIQRDKINKNASIESVSADTIAQGVAEEELDRFTKKMGKSLRKMTEDVSEDNSQEKGNADVDEMEFVDDLALDYFDKVPHLLLSSKVMQCSVQGTAIVYISNLKSDVGYSTQPNPLQLKGENLKVGWGLLSGDFKYQSTSMSGKLRGNVAVTSYVPCQKKYCEDVK